MSVRESCSAETGVSMAKRWSWELLQRSPFLKLRPFQQGKVFVVIRGLGRHFRQHKTKFIVDLQPGVQPEQTIDKGGDNEPREHSLLEGAAGEKKRRTN